MIRKFNHIALFLLLLTATTGLAVTKHYCHGLPVSVGLYNKAESCCDDDCCDDHSEFIQIENRFVAPENSTPPATAVSELPAETSTFQPLHIAEDYPQGYTETNKLRPPDAGERLSLKQAYLL